MIIGIRRDGSPIMLNTPDALLVFKTYGKPLASGLVQLKFKHLSCTLNPDTGSISALTCAVLKEKEKEKEKLKLKLKKHDFKFHPMSEAQGKKCTITGEKTTTDNAIITEEGHVYSLKGLRMIFSGGRTTARSPYQGAKPLVKSKYFF
jgi:hypothetical protein